MSEDQSHLQSRRPKEKEPFSRFIYNSDTGQCLGRTGISWAKILLFYVILYGLLTGMFAGLLIAFLSTVVDDHPKLYIGGDQAVLVTPGMNFYPRPVDVMDESVPLIRYSVSEPESYEPYLEQIRNELSAYNVSSQTLSTCMGGDANSDTCPLDLNSLSSCYDHDPAFDFGYANGRPCMLLRINRLYGWLPEAYADNPNNATIGSRWDPASLPVECYQYSARKSDSNAEIGDVDYYPAEGFPISCFPFCGKLVEYSPPPVMIKFQDLPRNTDTGIACRFYAVNVGINPKQGTGMAVFRLKIDD